MGRMGVEAPNSLTFDFEPKILFILSNDATGAMMAINGSERATAYLGGYSGVNLITFSGDTVSWCWYSGGNSSTYSYVQQNQDGMTYNYIAFGE